MRVYISGPMTGLENHNEKAFRDAERELSRFGHEAINPHEVCRFMHKDSKWTDYLREDLKAMLDCEAVVYLDGWESSHGAMLEINTAQRVGMKIYSIHYFLESLK